MNWTKRLLGLRSKKKCAIHNVSKSDIELHCMNSWSKSEGTWNHYLAAKEYEKILSKRHGC